MSEQKRPSSTEHRVLIYADAFGDGAYLACSGCGWVALNDLGGTDLFEDFLRAAREHVPTLGKDDPTPAPEPSWTPPRRLRLCVEAWPECATGEYHPRCCRFPKSCSCTVYDEGSVTEDDLEPARGKGSSS